MSSIKSWTNPHEIGFAVAPEPVSSVPPPPPPPAQAPPSPRQEPIKEQPKQEQPQRTQPKHEEKKQENGFDMSMLSSLIPLLGGGNPQMEMISNLLQKGGKPDMTSLVSLLPMLMNSGLFKPKQNAPTQERIINLSDYKQLN